MDIPAGETKVLARLVDGGEVLVVDVIQDLVEVGAFQRAVR